MSRSYTTLTNATPKTLLEELLALRGVVSDADKAAFLTPDYGTLHDPLLMHDMRKAVDRISTAITNQEQIAIFSDYDCDGIPGGVVQSLELFNPQHSN